MNRNLDTLQAIYQAFGKGDIPAILSRLSPDVKWDAWEDHSAQRAGYELLQARTGPQDVAGFFQCLGAHKIHEFKLLDIMAGERQAAAEVFIDFTYAPTGQRVRDEEMHLWSFGEDGRVTRFRHYIDTGKHARAAGLRL